VYYSFDDDDNTGSNPDDLSGNGNDGTNSGGTTGVTGILNQAYSFGTSDNILVAGTDTSWNVASESKTFSLWYKGSSSNGNIMGDYASSTDGIAFFVNSDNSFKLELYASTGFSITVPSTYRLNDNTWKHLVVVINPTSQKVYIDGTERGSTTVSLSGTVNLNNFRINCRGDGAGGATSCLGGGTYDEFGYYDREISSAEVTELYNSGDGFNPYASSPSNDFFTVTAKDVDTSATLSNITVTLQNGTQYTNITNSQVITPFNDSSLQNFTVSVDNYFNQTFTNYNTSVDLQANLTQYPQVGYYNVFNNQSLNGYIYTGVTGWDDTQKAFSGYTNIYTITNGRAYIPVNISTRVVFAPVQAQSSFGFYEFYAGANPKYTPISLVHNFANSNDINQSTFQASLRLNASAIITNNAVSPANFTINGITKGVHEYFYLDVGNYNITFSKDGWFSKTQQFNINYTYSNLIPTQITDFYNQTQTISGVSDTAFNLTIYNFYNVSDTLSTFQVYASNNAFGYTDFYSVTTGSVAIATISNLLMNLTFTSTGFHNTSYLNYNTSNDLNAPMFPTNQILMRFYSASTGLLINQTVNVTAQNSTTEKTFVFQNGQGVVDDLPQSLSYIFTINTAGFTTANFFRAVPVPSVNTPAMDFYILETGQNVTFTISDTAGSPLEGSLVQIERFVTGTYQLVASQETDITGNAYLSLVLANTHKVTISKSGYKTVQFVTPSLQNAYAITLQTTTDINLDYDYSLVRRDYSPKTPYLNTSLGAVTFTVSITSQFPVLDYVGFKLVNLSNPSHVLYEFNTTANLGAIMTHDLNISTMQNERIGLIYYFQITGYNRTTTQVVYFITDSQSYTGTLLELKDILSSELTETQRLFYFVATFIVTMILLAVVVRGVVNVGISLALSLIVAFILGVNLFIIGTITIIIFIAIIALSRTAI
jgi:hypothetical protein